LFTKDYFIIGDHFMNFSQFKFTYNALIFILNFTIWLIVVFWIIDGYRYFKDSGLISIFVNFSNFDYIDEVEISIKEIQNTVKNWLINTGWFILKIIIIIKVIIWLIKNYVIIPAK